jgi:hypothetical protein
MAYSVMVWLVDPGVHPQQEDEEVRIQDGRESAPGARSGVNIGYSIPRMVYGVYESQDEAESTLKEISNNLQQNVPLRLSMHGNREFLIPADRVQRPGPASGERLPNGVLTQGTNDPMVTSTAASSSDFWPWPAYGQRERTGGGAGFVGLSLMAEP